MEVPAAAKKSCTGSPYALMRPSRQAETHSWQSVSHGPSAHSGAAPRLPSNSTGPSGVSSKTFVPSARAHWTMYLKNCRPDAEEAYTAAASLPFRASVVSGLDAMLMSGGSKSMTAQFSIHALRLPRARGGESPTSSESPTRSTETTATVVTNKDPAQTRMRPPDAHRIHNPFTPDKFAALGAALRLESGARVLDLGSGSGEMLCTWARDHGITGIGGDMSQLFTEQAKRRAQELGVADRVTFIHGDAAGYVCEEKVRVAACGAAPPGSRDDSC
jgi:hypothetical protein